MEANSGSGEQGRMLTFSLLSGIHLALAGSPSPAMEYAHTNTSYSSDKSTFSIRYCLVGIETLSAALMVT